MVLSGKRTWCALGMLMVSLALSLPAAPPVWWEDVGFNQLKTELGANTPDGSSVTVSQIEAPEPPNNYYAPDTANPEFTNITFTLKSGSLAGYSGHATTQVGQNIYGSTLSIAPGITQVDAWEASNWINTALKFGDSSTSGEPDFETRDLQNHSWVASYGDSFDLQIIRRFDFAISRDQVLALVGVNNDNSVPGGGTDENLLSSSYHAIRVGRTDGLHMYGTTTIDTAGRQRVDIVAPGTTSRATARVSSAAAVLIDAVKENANYAAAIDPRVLKAILLSGATKEPAMAWTHSSTAPLNARYGAGEVNIAASHHILAAGQHPASASINAYRQGWDFNTVSSSAAKLYFFDVDDASDISITLAWHRVITQGSPPNGRWNSPTSTLADLKLRLCQANAFTVGTVVSESNSPIDPLEHIWTTSLAPGRYVIEVTSASGASTSYGIAWRTDLDGAIGLSFADTLPGHLRTGLMPSFTVQAVTVAGLPDPAYQGSITVSSTGTAGISGTLTVQAVNGVATFNNVTIGNHGTLILNAAASGFTTAVRSTIQVARLVDIFIPQFMQGEYDGNGQDPDRLPFAYRVRLDGLKPSSTYRYGNRVVDAATLLPDDPGQGNMLLARTSGDPFVRCTQSPSFLAADLNLRHGTFTTDAQGSYEGWFFSEPADHVIFTPGQLVRLRILLNDGNGGESQVIALTSSSTVQTIQAGNGGSQATPVIGEALSAARNIVFLYSDEAGSTRPLAGTPVEVTGAATDATYADYYHEAVAQTSRLWSTLVPNASFGSIRRIEERSLDTGLVLQTRTSPSGFAVPAADGTPAPLGGFTQYNRWAAAHFPSTVDLADPQTSGTGADPTDSGITNIQRYAGGLGSLDLPGPALVRITQDNTSALVGFPFDPALTDLRTRVYGSDTLPNLDTLLFDSTTAINPQPDSNGILWLDFSRDGIPRYFFRLQLDLIP